MTCVVLLGACTLDEEGSLFDAGVGGAAASGGVSGSPNGGASGVAGADASSGGTAGGAGIAGSGGAPIDAGTGGSAGGSAGSAGNAGSAGTAGAGGAPVIPPCETLYTGLPGVNQVCAEDPAGQCRLAADTDPNDGDFGQTCAAICAAGGGECIQVLDNGVDACTPSAVVFDCTTTTDQTNAICFCSRGCGGNAPCGTGMTCTAGVCS